MRTIKEMCEILGLSHRTFRYYDYIGLLKPAAYTNAGYRLYDDDSVKRMVTIRLLVDVGFELSEIQPVLDDPDYDLQASLMEKSVKIGQEQENNRQRLFLIERIRREGIEPVAEERLRNLGI